MGLGFDWMLLRPAAGFMTDVRKINGWWCHR